MGIMKLDTQKYGCGSQNGLPQFFYVLLNEWNGEGK